MMGCMILVLCSGGTAVMGSVTLILLCARGTAMMGRMILVLCSGGMDGCDGQHDPHSVCRGGGHDGQNDPHCVQGGRP